MGTGYTRNDVSNNISNGSTIDADDLDGEFNAIETAFGTSGHTHDGTTAEGGPVSVIGPAQDLVVSTGAVTPKTDATVDLGASSFKMKDGYFSGSVVATDYTGDITGDVTGNADTADALSTARNIAISGQITGTGTAFDGSGNISIPVPTLSASNINAGTLASARLAGDYTGITAVGTMTAGSITATFGNIDIGSSIFTGDGSGITDLNATQLTTGTVPSAVMDGNYTGIGTLTTSGTATVDKLVVTDSGLASGPSITWTDGINDIGMILTASNNAVGFTYNSETIATIGSGGATFSNSAFDSTTTIDNLYVYDSIDVQDRSDLQGRVDIGANEGDGIKVRFKSSGVSRGSVSIAGSVTSYNSFMGSHWSVPDFEADYIPQGTIVETVDSLSKFKDKERAYLPKFKIASEGSKRVYGVFDRWDEEGEASIAALGSWKIRVNGSVKGGDLIEAGVDGVGVVQEDDIVRSTTVAKVTSNMAQDLYEDGSYTVPCVLMCG